MKHTVKVAGMTFENRQVFLARMSDGDEVLLRPEPDNAFDPNAVAVYWNAHKVGYLPRDVAAEVCPQMTGSSYDGVVQEVTGGSGNAPTYGLLVVFEL